MINGRNTQPADNYCFIIILFIYHPYLLFCCFTDYNVIKWIHQTAHLFGGYNGLPNGQLKASENSLRFESTPITRNISGLCSSVSTCCTAAASFLCPHQN